jgi:L-amino acid N-acyltransferase YncA
MNRFTAKIGMDNKPSLKMFEGIGFTEVGLKCRFVQST